LVFLALMVKSLVRVLSWHEIALRTSSLASSDDGFGPRRLAEHSLALVSRTTAATLWSTALACGAGRSKNPVGRQVTDGRVLSEHISSQGSLAEPGLHQRRRELAPCELLPWCYCSSTQVEELVLEVLPYSCLRCPASEL